MRFPDLLVKVDQLHQQLRALELDVARCREEIGTMKYQLQEALPAAAKFFSDVPRETDNPEVSNGDPTLL